MSKRRKKYHYLVCSTNKAGKGCSPHTFSEDKLKAIVLRVVNDHIELIAQVEQVLDYIASLPEQERRIINYDAQMTALEITGPAQDDITYSVSLENAGEPEVYPGKTAQAGG